MREGSVPSVRRAAAAAIGRAPRESAVDSDTPRRGRRGPSSSVVPIGLGDVAAHANRFEIDERLIAVIALVADDFFDAAAVGPHRLDLLGRFDQRLDACRRVPVVRTRQRAYAPFSRTPTPSPPCAAPSGPCATLGAEQIVYVRHSPAYR